MIRNRTTDLLTSFGYPSIGISQSEALKPGIFVGEDGKWVLGLKSGHFYDDTGLEKYNFVASTSLASSLASGLNTVVLPQSVNYHNSTLEIFGSTYQYLPILEHLKAAQILSWTEVSSGVYEASFTSGNEVVAVRNLSQDFFKVSREVDLDSYSYYVTQDDKIKVKSSTAPASTIVVDLLDPTPQALVSEILTIGSTILPSYFYRFNLVLSRGSSSFSYSGLSSGEINNPFGTSEVGYWVKAEYYVPYSWTPSSNYSQIKVFTAAASDSVTILQETANKHNYSIPVTQTTSGLAHFNPLLPNSLKFGYLFHHSNDATLLNERTCDSIEINLSSDTVCTAWGEVVQARIRVLHKNGLPIPNKTVAITLLTSNLASSLSSSLITYSYPSSTITDSKGEMILSITPTQSFYIRAVTDSVTGLKSCTAVSSGDVLTASRLGSGEVSLILESSNAKNNSFNLYTQKTNLYGYPSDTSVTILSRSGGVFTNTETTSSFNKEIDVSTSRTISNLFGLSQRIRFFTVLGTDLISSYGGATSRVIKINE